MAGQAGQLGPPCFRVWTDGSRSDYSVALGVHVDLEFVLLGRITNNTRWESH